VSEPRRFQLTRQPLYFDDLHTGDTFTTGTHRCFRHKELTNLLLTGASLSFTFETIFMVMRNFPLCTQTGEIAGLTAARSVRHGITPNRLQWDEPSSKIGVVKSDVRPLCVGSASIP
jgi:hypothetical protein